MKSTCGPRRSRSPVTARCVLKHCRKQRVILFVSWEHFLHSSQVVLELPAENKRPALQGKGIFVLQYSVSSDTHSSPSSLWVMGRTGAEK